MSPKKIKRIAFGALLGGGDTIVDVVAREFGSSSFETEILGTEIRPD
jgi:hypothetical protein